MKITVITSSPRKKGTTAHLADEFIRGTKEAGHDVFRFDAAFEKVAPCVACDRCGMGGAKCVQNDSMEKLNPELLAADCVVFVTPLYYFGVSAQLKAVIDRFYANSSKLTGGKKAILISAAYDAKSWTMKALTEHYQTIVKYMNWEDSGMVLATGCGSRNDVERTDYPAQAYQLGEKL